MTPSRRADAARALGCEVSELAPVTVAGVEYPRFRVLARDNEHCVQVFNALARQDADAPAVRELAARFVACTRGMGPTVAERYLAERIHRFVRETVKFQAEEDETSRPPGLTFALGAGDCDEHAGLVCALGWSAGLRARVVGIRDASGDITHVCAVLGVGGVSYWAETTVDAHFGEHPKAAARRLGMYDRVDVVG